jgi:conjugative transposon TraM protein
LAPAPAICMLLLLFVFNKGGKDAQSATQPLTQGFNTVIPAAHFLSRQLLEKGDYYARAEQDSLARLAQIKTQDAFANRTGIGADSNVHKAEQKIEEITRAISQPPPTLAPAPNPTSTQSHLRAASVPGQPKDNPDIEKLERMMGLLKKKNNEEDPGMAQINSVLDKLMAVEHPDLVKDSSKKKTDHQRETMPVGPTHEPRNASQLDSGQIKSPPEMIALIPDEQSLTAGERLKLELAQDLLVGRQLVPRGSPIYGTTNLSGERLLVNIYSISWDEHILPVSLQVYDQDGLPGIYIPGVPGTDALKESANQDIGSLETGVLSPTLAGQATGAGIEAARSLIGKKIRRLRVVVPADYRLILKDGHKANNL